MVVGCFIQVTYKLQQNHSKNPAAVLYRFKTVHIFLLVSQSELEPLSMLEVTAFFKP